MEGKPLHFHDGVIEIRRISKIDQETKRLFTIDFLLVTNKLKDVWENRELIKMGRWNGVDGVTRRIDRA